MDIDFDLLIELQRLDDEIRHATLVLEGLPRLLHDVEQRGQAASKLVAEAKERLAQNQKKRRDLETEVKDLKAQIGKYKRQLNEVKTNKEYTALLKEIDETQHRIDGLEETIIAEMLAADDLEDAIKAAMLKQGQEEESLRREKAVLEEKRKETEAKAAALRKQREALLPRVPRDQLKLYETISQKKGGAFLSPLRGEFCSMCHMRVRPQMLNEVLERAKIILCENCGRILTSTEKPEPAKPETPPAE